MPEPRTWTIALPPGTPLLNANQRLHWAEKGTRTRILRHSTWALARQAKLPQLARARVVFEYRPPNLSRRRDAGNLAPSGKACLDGLTDAKVWPDDDSRHVVSETYRIGDRCEGGQFLIHIYEVLEEADNAPQ